MRKFELHLDALITMITIFVVAVSVILFQRYQYSDLLQENIDLAWDNANLEVNLEYKTTQFESCRVMIDSKQETMKDIKQNDTNE